MSENLMRITTTTPYEETVEAVRAELGEAGFGVLTEIDLRATLKEKLGADVPPQVILGACRPQLAHEALQADPSVASLLPCNVVVRAESAEQTVVEAFDPLTLLSMTDDAGDAVRRIADDARNRLRSALSAVEASCSR